MTQVCSTPRQGKNPAPNQPKIIILSLSSARSVPLHGLSPNGSDDIKFNLVSLVFRACELESSLLHMQNFIRLRYRWGLGEASQNYSRYHVSARQYI